MTTFRGTIEFNINAFDCTYWSLSASEHTPHAKTECTKQEQSYQIDSSECVQIALWFRSHIYLNLTSPSVIALISLQCSLGGGGGI